uniref:KIB1-4 beta-propeller domain-containing protein n=1 Tax=Aegilops tauschii TaxID=37682 RepID=N1QY74_AEGTA
MEKTAQTAAGDDASIQGTSLAAAAAAERWSTLPDDLLRLVHAKLTGPVDGARFAAVCTSWRAIVPTLPSRLPWLILDPSSPNKAKHVYSLKDDTILPPIPFPSEAVGKRFVGSYGGGWVVPADAPLKIVNLFSRAEVLLSTQQKKVRIVNQFTGPDGAPTRVRWKDPPARLGTGDQLHPLKIIFSGPPTSSSCILAAITDERDVAVCVPGHPEREWTRRRYEEDVVLDITFCNGDLYCLLGRTKQLVKCEVSLTEFGVAAFGANQWLAMPNRHMLMEGKSEPHDTYILEVRGKLVMAVRRIKGPWPRPRNIRGPFFLVFALIDAGTDEAMTHRHSYKWKEIKSFGDHALFLGPTCAKAMRLSTTDEHGDLRRNYIYYSHHNSYVEKKRGNGPKGLEKFFTSFNNDHVYYKEHESIDNVVVEGITSVWPPGVCMASKRFGRKEVMDIAFCKGNLYCIMSCTKEIVKFKLRIVNLFSGAEVALSPTQRTRCARDPFVPQKVIFSEPPALSGCILAAITDKYGVAIRGLARSERAWRSRFTTREVMDIAFCNGDLYCIMSCTKQIVKFEVGLDECGFAVFKSDPQCLVIHNQWDMDRLYLGAEGDPDAHAIYIVELRGKLAMVVRRTGGPRLCSRNISGPFFLVFELVDADINRATPHCWYKWKEVTSLGDQALFLGPTCSKAMHLLSTSEYGGPRRNHIYYSHRRCYTRKERLPDDTKEFLTSSNIDGTHVYFKEDERVDDDVEGITSVGYYVYCSHKSCYSLGSETRDLNATKAGGPRAKS